MSESLQAVQGILATTLGLGERAERLTADTPLLGGIPEFDSMAVVTVLTAFEEQFGIFIEDDEVSAETFETVGTLAEFLEQKLA